MRATVCGSPGAPSRSQISGGEKVYGLCDGKVATITGTEGNGTLRGTRANDVVVALGGDDVYQFPGGGNDTV